MAPIHLKLINLIALCTLVYSSTIYRTQQSNAPDALDRSHNSKARMQGSQPSAHLHANIPSNQGDNHDGQGDPSFPDAQVIPRAVDETYLNLGANQPDVHAWGGSHMPTRRRTVDETYMNLGANQPDVHAWSGTHLPTRSSHGQDTTVRSGIVRVAVQGPQQSDIRSVESGAKAVPGAHGSKASTAKDGEYDIGGLGLPFMDNKNDTPAVNLPRLSSKNHKREIPSVHLSFPPSKNDRQGIPAADLSVPTSKKDEKQATPDVNLPGLPNKPSKSSPSILKRANFTGIPGAHSETTVTPPENQNDMPLPKLGSGNA